MAHNKTLAKLWNIPEEDTQKIDEIHEQINELMNRASLGVFNESVYNAIEQLEFWLQKLWKFEVNPAYHTYKHAYAFKARWCGRRFRCVNTGEEFVIPWEVAERDFYSFGDCFVDVGRLDAYSRMGGPIQEIIAQVVEVK